MIVSKLFSFIGVLALLCSFAFACSGFFFYGAMSLPLFYIVAFVHLLVAAVFIPKGE